MLGSCAQKFLAYFGTRQGLSKNLAVNFLVEFLKQLASPTQTPIAGVSTPLLDSNENQKASGLINEDSEYFIKNSSIGDMTIQDLEKEAIIRTLKFFNNNRRASAKSLGMSERTLYRKINFYGLDRKIKSQ